MGIRDRNQVHDLTLAATVASFGPAGGTPGVSPDVQARLDTAIQTVTALGAEVQRCNGSLAQYDAALRTERGTAKAFQDFVHKREADFKGREVTMLQQIKQLDQQVFTLEHSPADPDTVAYTHLRAHETKAKLV